jgi:hypothetical protein
MCETLNADSLKIINSDYINDRVWAKGHLFKYYNVLNNTKRKKWNNNRNKELRYTKLKTGEWVPYTPGRENGGNNNNNNNNDVIDKERNENNDNNNNI